jgi:hypothetical protein
MAWLDGAGWTFSEHMTGAANIRHENNILKNTKKTK